MHIHPAPLCVDDDFVYRILDPILQSDTLGHCFPLWRLLPHHPKLEQDRQSRMCVLSPGQRCPLDRFHHNCCCRRTQPIPQDIVIPTDLFPHNKCISARKEKRRNENAWSFNEGSTNCAQALCLNGFVQLESQGCKVVPML